MKEHPGFSDDPLQCARELYRAGHYAGVVAVCSQALERVPMDAALLLERACAWIALWRADQAYADLHEVLLIDPACVRAYRVLGQLLVQGGKLSGARDAFRRALALEPGDAEARAAVEAVEARLNEVSRQRGEGRAEDPRARRPQTAPVARGADLERARGYRRATTSPTGHALPTLTTLIRRAPAGVPASRSREKTAPLRAAPPHVRVVAPGRAATSPGHGAGRASSPLLRTPPSVRAATAPMVRAATSPLHDRTPTKRHDEAE